MTTTDQFFGSCCNATSGTVCAPGMTSGEADRTRRLEAFFRGFGFTDPVRISHLIGCVATDPSATPEQAMDHAERQVAAWFRTVLGLDAMPVWQSVALGRAAFLQADGARRWPDGFLAAGQL